MRPGEQAVAGGPRPSRWTDRAIAAWRRRRLDVSGLEPRARAWAAVALGVAGLAAAGILALGSGWEPPGGRQPIGDDVGSVPRLAVVLTIVLLGAAAAALAAGTSFRGWSWRGVTIGAVALIGGSLAAYMLGIADVLVGLFPDARAWIPRAAGWGGIASAVTLALLGIARPRWTVAIAAAAAAPFALHLLAYATVSGSPYAPDPSVLARDVVAAATLTTALNLRAAVGVLLLWGVYQAVRQARDMGGLTSGLVSGSAAVIRVLALAKAVWVAAGLVDRLPGWLGGSASSWAESRANGWYGWAFAVAFVAASAWWLLERGRRPPPLERSALDRPVAVVSTGFALPIVAGTVIVLGIELAFAWPTNGPARVLNGWLDAVYDPRVWTWSVIATIVVVAVLLASGWLRDRFLAPATVTVFAGLLVLWSAPRIGPIAWSLLNERPAPVQSPTLVTVDAVLSFAIAAAMLVSSVRRRSWVSIDTVWLALVVSSLVAHPGILIPSEWRSGTLFFLALIYAPAYRFLFDATSLNERREDHAARVVRAAGVSALLLTVTMFGVAEDQVGPGLASPLDLFLKDAGRLFLAVPVAVVLVLASRGSDTTDRPPPARAGDVAPTDARLEP